MYLAPKSIQQGSHYNCSYDCHGNEDEGHSMNDVGTYLAQRSRTKKSKYHDDETAKSITEVH